MDFVPWSESIPFPKSCEYCLEGCSCGSPYGLQPDEQQHKAHKGTCDYCENDGDEDDGEDECECCECGCDCEPLAVEAGSYNRWIAKTCYRCDLPCLSQIDLSSRDIDLARCHQQIGAYDFFVRVMPSHQTVFPGLFGGKPERIRTSLEIAQGSERNKVHFSGPILTPIISRPVRDESKVWMSLTPMEIFTQREALRLARGHVLIAGLGMGWLTRRVLENPEISGVTQIEIDSEILSFFGEPLVREFKNIDLIHADIWEYLDAVNIKTFDTVLFDIWPLYGHAYYDNRFKTLQNLHPNIWGWGDYDMRG